MITRKILKTTKSRVSVALLVSILGLIPNVPGQTNAPARRSQPQAQRFLVVFEASRGMSRRADNAIKTVSNLISSGVNGQMQTGDTLGIWTFNDTLNAGKFPLAKWSSDTSQKIAQAGSAFLHQQKFEKGAAFHSVMPLLSAIVESSDRLTIIVVSSGDTDFSGTKYDDLINESFKTWRGEQQKTRMPMVTVIRASRGEFVGNSITPAPWQPEIPPWPQRLLAAATAKTNTTAVVKSTLPAATTNALIFTGKKSAPDSAPALTTLAGQPANTNTTASSAAANPGSATNQIQSPVFISAASITNGVAAAGVNLAATPTPIPAPAQTGSANRASADSPQSGSALQVHARALQDDPKPAMDAPSPAIKPAQTVAVLPAPSVLSRKVVLTVGVGLTAMAGIFLFLRGGAKPRQESLITRSYQRGRK